MVFKLFIKIGELIHKKYLWRPELTEEEHYCYEVGFTFFMFVLICIMFIIFILQ